MFFIEALGIIATIFVVLSFTFKKLRTVRIVNLIGSILFIAYVVMLAINAGTLIGFISIILVNTILLLINGTHLLRKTDQVY